MRCLFVHFHANAAQSDYASDNQCVCCVPPDVYLFLVDVSVTHVVARCVGLHGVLGCQSDAAHGDDHQDAHLKVAQVDHIMAQSAYAARHTHTFS